MSAMFLFFHPDDVGGELGPPMPEAEGRARLGVPGCARPSVVDPALLRGWAREHPFEAEALLARLGLPPAAAGAAFTQARARERRTGA